MKNGTVWLDDQGQPIQAHGGMIARFDQKWYWYGENKGAPNCPGTTRVDVIGVSCYSSDDLHTWHHEGIVLPSVPEDPSCPLHPSQVLERPKVLHCERTGKYVMWFHSDSPNYMRAQAGCAVADSPVGPFRFVRAQCPNRLDCRDMTVFVDQEKRAWLVHSGNWNKTPVLFKAFRGLSGLHRRVSCRLHRSGAGSPGAVLSGRAILVRHLRLHRLVAQQRALRRVKVHDLRLEAH